MMRVQVSFSLRIAPVLLLRRCPSKGADYATEKEVIGIFEEILEEGASIQSLFLADHRISRFLFCWEGGVPCNNSLLDQLSQKRGLHYRNREKVQPRMFRFFFSYSIPSNSGTIEQDIVLLTKKKKSVLKTLGMMTYVFPWTPKELLETIGGLINFDLSPDLVSRRWNPLETIAQQFPNGGRIRIKEDRLEWKTETETSFKSFRIGEFPDQWALNAMSLLIGDPFRESYRVSDPFYIHFGVHCPKQSKEESSFWRKSQLIENQGKSGTLIRLIPELENELSECHCIRRDLKKGARFVWTQMSAGIWSKEERFEQACQSLKSLFRINQFQAIENTSIHLPQFLSILPMAWSEYVQDLKDLGVLRTTLSTECSNLVPIHGEWMGTETPGMLLMGRRGQLLNWNPFDNKSGNFNVVVSGRSGSGKSVFMQDLLLSGLRMGGKVFILDVGRSFEKLCEYVEGQKIEFSGEADLCLNPFSNVPLVGDEQAVAFSFLKSIIGCMAAPTTSISDIQNAWIEKAIKSAWESKKNKATITDVAAWLLSQDDKTAKELGGVLVPFTKDGIYARYFEGENNVDFTNPLVLIELEELKEKKDLQAAVLQLFILSIANRVFLGDRKTPFFICIDEAWDLLRSKQTGVFIETLARRLRKYNGSLIVGTQSVEDFFATPGAQAAYQNSDWMCFLSQKRSSINCLSEGGKLEIDESRIKALESVYTRHGEFSEIMIIDGDSNFSIARLILDPFSQLLYSTTARDHSRIETLRKRGLSLSEAINHLLEVGNV
ncbi:MAG: type IV secretion system protein TraC [Waddliaceae bacterium]